MTLPQMPPTTTDNHATTTTTSPTTTPGTSVEHKGLAALKAMSTTAGVGLGEYRAVNPFAVTAAVLGIAGLGAAIHPLLLLLSVLAIGFGAIALWQIRASNGTQAGWLPAILGIAAGVGLLLVFGWDIAATYQQDRKYRAEVKEQAEAFGEALVAGDFASAYQMTGEEYRERVSLESFSNALGLYPRVTRDDELIFGNFTGVSTSDLTQITRDSATGQPFATAELIVTFERAEPARYQVGFTRLGEEWFIFNFGDWNLAG